MLLILEYVWQSFYLSA